MSRAISASPQWQPLDKPCTSSLHAAPPFAREVGRFAYPQFRNEEALSFLSVKRLNDISSHLWLAGRPQSDPLQKSTLHRLKATGFELVVFEHADLHLLWGNGMIYVKPLPSFLLNYDFWEQNLCSPSPLADLDHADIIDGALGLLFSYTWLIRWESDLKIAHDHGLLPTSVDFERWLLFRESFLTTFKRAQLPMSWLSWRYDFAELRLNRINLVWRLRPRSPYDISSLIRGYQTPYRLYTGFFEKHFSIVIVIFVYITVVLTAMQVGLSTDELQGKSAFRSACVGFTIFCIILPLAILAFVLALFVVLFFFNWWATKRHLRSLVSPR